MSAATLDQVVAEFEGPGALLALLRSIHVVADLAANGLEHLDGTQIERADMVAVLDVLAGKAREAMDAAGHITTLLAQVKGASDA